MGGSFVQEFVTIFRCMSGCLRKTDLEILPRAGLVRHPGVIPLGPGPRSGFFDA